MTNRPKVLVTNPFTPQIGLDLLKQKCDLVICQGKPPSLEEILEKVKNVDALYWCTQNRLDEKVVDTAGPNLKVVGTLSVGFDNIDVDLLKSRGIKAGNTACVLNDSVAEVALGLVLNASHRFQEGRDKILKGEWEPGSNNPLWLNGQQLSGSVVGIVGLGRIGSEVAARLKPFKLCRLLYTGQSAKSFDEELGAEFVSMNDLVQHSDFIILTCSLNEKTKNLFNKTLFSKMKSNAIIINVSRGGVINQDDLIEALTNGVIGGAALDVTTPEPLPKDHPLTKLKNCVLSPHVGSCTTLTRNAMAKLTAENILAGLDGKPLPSPIF